uniref:hypothetical protein n=1 Tax=Aliarcobacter sp. TaxID=2321116 RepID=UPI004048408F
MIYNYFNIKLLLIYIGLGLFLGLFSIGMMQYTESKVIYALFSTIFFILLFYGIYKPITYSFLFLSIFLFLGFWFKLTVHLILDYSYVEPIGSFYSSNSSMDEVLVVSMIGAIAILIVYFLFNFFNLNKTIKIFEDKNLYKKKQIYNFYKKYKTFILYCLFFVIILVSVLNVILNIHLIGIVPTTIPIFPLNILIYWLLNIGFVLIFSYFVYLEIKYEKLLNLSMIFLFLFVCALCSIVILSRGSFI